MSFHTRLAKRILRKAATKGPKKLRQVNKKITRKVEEARQFLPLTRGGTGFKPRSTPRTTIPTTPGPTGEAVRWKPTPAFKPKTPQKPQQEMTRVTRIQEDALQIELQDMFDQLPTEGQQELAYLTLRENNQADEQNQTLENALARMAADRPRQFERQNILPKKKRKVSAYSKRFGIELKKLKKLHPRTKIQNLMAKAHRRTRAAMKKK